MYGRDGCKARLAFAATRTLIHLAKLSHRETAAQTDKRAPFAFENCACPAPPCPDLCGPRGHRDEVGAREARVDKRDHPCDANVQQGGGGALSLPLSLSVSLSVSLCVPANLDTVTCLVHEEEK